MMDPHHINRCHDAIQYLKHEGRHDLATAIDTALSESKLRKDIIERQISQEESTIKLGNMAIVWHTKAMQAIMAAGGSPELIKQIPEKLLVTMIRNNICLVYCKPDK